MPYFGFVIHPELWAFMFKLVVLLCITFSTVLLYTARAYGRAVQSATSTDGYDRAVKDHRYVVWAFLFSLLPLVIVVLALEFLLRSESDYLAPVTMTLVVHWLCIVLFAATAWRMARTSNGAAHPQRHRVLARWHLFPSYWGMVATGLLLLYYL